MENENIFAPDYLQSLQQKLKNRALALAIGGERPDLASSLIREIRSSEPIKNPRRHPTKKDAVIINVDELTLGIDKVEYLETEFNVGERQIRMAHHTL